MEACPTTGRIEDVFKELKDFHFDQYQVRSLKAIEHMWHLALAGCRRPSTPHTYLQGLRLEVIKLPNCKRPTTLGDALAELSQ